MAQSKKKTKKAAPKKKTATEKVGAKKKSAPKPAAKKKPAKKPAVAAKATAKTAPTSKPVPLAKPSAPLAPKPAAQPKPATPKPEAAPAPAPRMSGGITAADVNLGHIAGLKPRTHTGFRPEAFQEAKRALADARYTTIEEAARAVAEKATELSNESGPDPFRPA